MPNLRAPCAPRAIGGSVKRPLTDALIRTLPTPTTGRAELSDLRCTGLTFRVTTNDARSWSFRFRDPQSRRSTYATIGRYPDLTLADARKAADAMRRQVAGGINPVSLKRQERADATTQTFQHLTGRYLEEHARRFKRSHATDERNLKLHVLPARTGTNPQPWEKRRYDGIRRADVIELIESIVKDGKPSLANSVHALISSIYTFAVDADLVGSHPCARLKKRGVERIGRRVLSDNEIRLFWPKITDAPVSLRVGLALRLMLLTGARPGEVAGLSRGELHSLEQAEPAAWVLPGARSKNKREHLIPLGTLARQTITEALALIKEGDGFLFPSPRGAKQRGPISPHALAVAMRRFADKATGKTSESWRAEPPTPHDLRRTVRTRLASIGIRKEICDRVLNHTPPKSDTGERHYNLYEYATEKRQALATWETALGAILNPSNVVIPIAGRKAKASRTAG